MNRPFLFPIFFTELPSETKEFFDFMIEQQLMDLVAKKGKESGGYCTYLPDYKAPFIFSNFNYSLNLWKRHICFKQGTVKTVSDWLDAVDDKAL